MKELRNLALFFLVVFGLSFFSLIKPTLLDNHPVAPYLNGVFPDSSLAWSYERAFGEATFDEPIWLSSIPSTNDYLLTLRKGEVWFIDSDNNPSGELMMTIEDRVFNDTDAALFDIAFHPEFGLEDSSNGAYIYLMYCYLPPELNNPNGQFYYRVSRFSVKGDFESIDPDSEFVLIQHFDRHNFHNGGSLFFDKHGFLNISVGDEGDDNDFYGNSQIINNRLFGGILRIDVDNDMDKSHPVRRLPVKSPDLPEGWPDDINQGYSIPNDNPWVSESEDWLEEFFVIGLRSPHAVYYDSVMDEIWVGDVGQALREEISVFTKGGNGQWPYKEGFIDGPKSRPAQVLGTEVPPLHDYGRSDGLSVIGGVLYRGEKFPLLNGKYIFGDYGSGNIWALDRETQKVQFLTQLSIGSGDYGFVSFLTDATEEIYFVQIYSGEAGAGFIQKLVPPKEKLEAPQYLSQVGAFKDLQTLEPIVGIIPYELNTVLYSDGASKKRWVALPNDGVFDEEEEQVIYAENSDWKFPKGTVFIKHFELPVDETDPSMTERIETRFLVLTENGESYGVTYQWNEEGTDAEILEDAAEKEFVIKTELGEEVTLLWNYPSRAQCLTCHNAISQWALGPNTHALNKDYAYSDTDGAMNQIEHWNESGIFTRNLTNNDLIDLPRSVSLDDESASNELKVRSYIDMNCSFCHRHTSDVEAEFSARFNVPLEQQEIVNAPTFSRNSNPDAFIIKPQDLENSEMYQRVHKIGENQMPLIGRNTVDEKFATVLKDWIMELTVLDSENSEVTGLTVYPNPVSSGELTISGLSAFQEKTHIQVVSMEGKIVYQSSDMLSSTAKIPVDWKDGIYILRITHGSTEYTMRIVKE